VELPGIEPPESGVAARRFDCGSGRGRGGATEHAARSGPNGTSFEPHFLPANQAAARMGSKAPTFHRQRTFKGTYRPVNADEI
jgi:hypothetical protein